MPNTSVQAAAEGLPINQIDDAVTKLVRAKELNNLLGMAGEGLLSRLPCEANALMAGSNAIDELLIEVRDMLETAMAGGAA